MFCPKCGAEYREGITICADCGVPLVEELHEEEEETVEFVEVLETFNAVDVAMIKSIFDTNEIRYYIKDENFHLMRPMALPMKVMVADEDVERAKELLSKLKLSIRAISPPEDNGEDE